MHCLLIVHRLPHLQVSKEEPLLLLMMENFIAAQNQQNKEFMN